jgi:ectoine hydroxylase-related dioxygenase (phytanoyl-CoA dioxygenase family)
MSGAKPALNAMRTEIEAYACDGVAVLRSVVPPAAAEALVPVAEDIIEAALAEAADTGLPPNLKHVWQHDPAFEAMAFSRDLAHAAGKVIGSESLHLVMDQLWTKAPRSRQRTRWHHDSAAWPVTGEMLPSLWLALTPIAAENCLRFVAGSHNAPHPEGAFIDYDDPARTADFLAWDMAPGDALLFHPRVYHGCRGNTAPTRRIAYTLRWVGDDIRYAPRRKYINEGISFASCRPGEPLVGFPKVL